MRLKKRIANPKPEVEVKKEEKKADTNPLPLNRILSGREALDYLKSLDK